MARLCLASSEQRRGHSFRRAAGAKSISGSLPRVILRFVSETAFPTEATPQDIRRRIDAGEPLVLIDVREPEEFAITGIEGATLIPMRTIPAHLQQLEARADEATLIVFCHHGVRSLNVVHWLRQQGLDACQSMAGGIDAWSTLVDPSVQRY